MIQDFNSLVQAIVDFSKRDTLAPFAPYFIQDGEDRVYRAILAQNEGRGVSWMEAPLAYTISASGFGAVPSDFLAPKHSVLQTTAQDVLLINKPPGWIYDNYPMRSADSVPAYVAKEGANFIFGPFPDAQYSVVGQYYQRALPLSSSNSTTWMTANMPLTLLAGCMASVSRFLKDPEGEQIWAKDMMDRLADLVTADKAVDYSDGTLVIEVA